MLCVVYASRSRNAGGTGRPRSWFDDKCRNRYDKLFCRVELSLHTLCEEAWCVPLSGGLSFFLWNILPSRDQTKIGLKRESFEDENKNLKFCAHEDVLLCNRGIEAVWVGFRYKNARL